MTPIPDVYTDEDATEREPYVDMPTALPPVFPPYMPRPARSALRRRPIVVVLTISFLLALVATGMLAYIFISKRPAASFATASLTANHTVLRVNDSFTLTGSGFGAIDTIAFTRDMNVPILNGNQKPLQVRSDAVGAFTVSITVGNWGTGDHIIRATDGAQQFSDSVTITIEQVPSGPPRLQLAAAQLDFGAAAPGVVSSENLTLTNAGGGQLRWQASSDQPWLSVTPGSDTFNGSEVVIVTVNRGALSPLSYTGHLSFVQQDSGTGKTSKAQPLKLTVTMAVKAAPASLTLSQVSLSFSGDTTQNPASQTITLQNSSKQPISWSAKPQTGNSLPWLTIAPASGQLAPGASVVLTVSVQSQQLPPGSYQGTINFTGGANPRVNVSLSVVAPGNVIVSPPSLNFLAYTGQNPASQSITLQNSGGQLLNWTVSTVTANGGNWLSASPSSGQLASGSKGVVTIVANVTGLSPNAYQGTVSLNAGVLSKQIAVSLTVSNAPVPSINTQVHTLDFSTLKGSNPVPQSFTLTNTGNATLNWAASEDSSAAAYIHESPASGSLAPARSATITVSPAVQQLGGGSLTGTITIADSDAGTSVPSQKVVVNVTVQDQAVISVVHTLSFGNDSTFQNTQEPLVLTNNGSADLNWTLTIPAASSAPWLSVDSTSGTLSPNASTVINVDCDSSQLSPGTYTASLQISDSDANTPVASQTVDIVLTVN